MNGAIVTEEEVSSNEGASTLGALERSFFGICKAISFSLHFPASRACANARHFSLYLRDLSCLLRCSLLENARLQNWHLYFFSGAPPDAFLVVVGGAVLGVITLIVAAAAGILVAVLELVLVKAP
jgi:hypothetical protein